MAARLELAGQDGTVVDLLPAWQDYQLATGHVQAMAGGDTSVGAAPDVTTVELFSQVVDGAAVAISTVGNAEFPLDLRFTSTTDSSGLTDVEQQLAAVVDQPATLTYAHPDGASPATVWDVQLAQLAPAWDDTAENRLVRNWVLTLTCWPWPRSEDLWTAEAVASPPATVSDTTLDAPATTAGWSTSTIGAAVVMDSGMVRASVTASPKDLPYIDLIRTGSFPLSASPYIKVTGAKFDTVRADMVFYVNGTKVDAVALIMGTSPIDRAQGWTAFLPVPAGVTTLTSLQVFGFKKLALNPNGVDLFQLWVDEIHLTNASPFGTDVRTQDRTIIVPGTKQTQAQVTVAATNASGDPIPLGDQVLLYTTSDPNVVAGDISAYRTTGPARTADATMLSGARTLITGTSSPNETYEIPISMVPAGTYLLMAKLASSTGAAAPATILYATQTDPQPVLTTAIGDVNITAPATQEIMPLGLLTLPSTQVANSAAVNQTIIVWLTTGSINLDTLFLLNIDEGQVSLIDTSQAAGSTADACTLIYNEPGSTDDDTPAYQLTFIDPTLGDLGDFDASSRVTSWAVHQFRAGQCRILAVATSTGAFGSGTNQLDVTVSAYPRWTAFAGEVDT